LKSLKLQILISDFILRHVKQSHPSKKPFCLWNLIAMDTFEYFPNSTLILNTLCKTFFERKFEFQGTSFKESLMKDFIIIMKFFFILMCLIVEEFISPNINWQRVIWLLNERSLKATWFFINHFLEKYLYLSSLRFFLCKAIHQNLQNKHEWYLTDQYTLSLRVHRTKTYAIHALTWCNHTCHLLRL